MKAKYIIGCFFLLFFHDFFAQIQIEDYVFQKETIAKNPKLKLQKTQNTSFLNAPKINLENNNTNIAPVAANSTDFNFSICDDVPYDGIYIFNLGIFQSLVETNPNYHYDYYPTLTDAQNQTNELPDLYTSGNAIIYIRIHDVTNPSLWGIYTLTLEVVDNNTTSPPANLIECEENGSGTATFDLTVNNSISTDSNPVIKYYTDAGYTNEITNPTAYVGTHGQIIYMKITNEYVCEVTTYFYLNVISPPTINSNITVHACDDNGDGVETFNLTNINSNTFILTYYEDINLTSEIPNLTTYVASNNTLVYIKVENQYGCHATLLVILAVHDIPNLNPVGPFELCDNDGNNQESFDLSTLNAQISTTATIEYYSDTALTNPITNISNYIVSGNQTVYVKGINANNCENVMQIDFSLNSQLNLNSVGPFELCDNDGNNQESFDLSTLNTQINATATIAYYSDAAHTNPITNISNYTVSGNQIVYVKGSDANGCENTMQIDFSLNSQLNLNPVGPFELCDNDGNNQESFDLSTLNTQINTTATIAYFSDAALTNPITNISNYTVSGNQIVYVKGSDANGCENTMQIDFSLNSQLNLNPVGPFELCDNDGNNQESFDLSTLNTQINAAATIEYFSDAALTNPITNISNYTVSGNQIVYVKGSDANGCENTMQIDFSLNSQLNLNPVGPFELCDNDGNN
ncbi:hypothetical protein, partial [Aureivirga sp. CE67]|uniref:hypothetical protein n=1 Tax=Aureivirga sp. CE67 TaxID=1788983 RepID=UPI0018CAB12E